MYHHQLRTRPPNPNSRVEAGRRAWLRSIGSVVAAVAILASIVGMAPTTADAATTVTVNPTEHFEVMATPGAGFQDFVANVPSAEQLANCTYDTTVENAGIKGGSLYVRLQWRDIEPAEGQYDWPMLDRLFACAEQRDQTIDFRLMLSYPGAGDRNCFPGESNTPDHGIPCWLVRKGVSELFYANSPVVPGDTYLPDWEDATIRSHHSRLVRAIGERYGDHPRLSSVDIGSVGLWGEWHAYPRDGQTMPKVARRIEIIDLYASAFPNTPLVILAQVFKDEVTGGSTAVVDHLRQNYAGRYGWRGDSWGASGHHSDDYEPIHAANSDLWKTAPVALEVTGIMSEWDGRMNEGGYTRVLPLDTIVNDAMDWHASLAHNKSSYIPPNYVDSPNADSRDLRFMATWMGPRLVLDQLSYSDSIEAGAQTAISEQWINRGSAPLYRDFRVTYRLRNSAGASTVIQSDTSMKGLLPTGDGSVAKTSTISIPSSLESGDYTLDVAVAHVDDVDLKMPLAITSEVGDNWYEIGPIEVSGNSRLSGVTASTPVNGQSASQIVDGNPDTGWANGGNAATANFTLDLGTVSDVSLIRYQDDYVRNLRITLDGAEIFSGWTPTAGEDVFAELDVSPPAQGRRLRVELISGTWLVPDEVEVYGSTTDQTSSRLIDMHNGFLLGQNQVWTELNANRGSLDPADQLVQTFRFTQAVTSGATGAPFETVSGGTELDVGELIVYAGPGDRHRVSKVTDVSGSWATFSPPITFAQPSGQQFWSLYGDGAHPNKIGYRALGDFVIGQFSAGELDSMANGKHLFLGDSWMEQGTPDNGRLADRIISLLGGETTVDATNRGVGGRTAKNVKDALAADFAAAGGSVDYVWLIVGTNDWIQEVPAETFAATVADIVNDIEGEGATAIVVNSSVGFMDGTREPGDIDGLLRLSQEYVAAEAAFFEQR